MTEKETMFSRLPDRHKAILALISANIIWGAASPVFKIALTNIPPFTLAFLRFFGAALLLYPLVATNPWIHRRDWIPLFVLSLFGVTIHIAFFFLGLTLAPAVNAAIIISSGPIFLYLLSILILHEKPHPRILTGLFISLCGIILIIGSPIVLKNNKMELVGNFFFVLSMIGAVGHAIASKEMLEKYGVPKIIFWSFLIGSVTFLPLFLFEQQTVDTFSTLNMYGVMGIIFGIFLSSALAYVLFEWGLRRMKAQEAGMFAYIDPIIATILAVTVLGEAVTWYFLAGCALVFGGMYYAERRIHRHPYHRLKHR